IYPKKGVIEVGADADFTVADMKREAVFTKADMLSKSGHTSWEGLKVKGLAAFTIVRGEVVAQDGKLKGSQGYGKFVTGTATA
ncbi:MAG: dihydroorotase, partial [Rhizobiaceae bacterium]